MFIDCMSMLCPGELPFSVLLFLFDVSALVCFSLSGDLSGKHSGVVARTTKSGKQALTTFSPSRCP